MNQEGRRCAMSQRVGQQRALTDPDGPVELNEPAGTPVSVGSHPEVLGSVVSLGRVLPECSSPTIYGFLKVVLTHVPRDGGNCLIS